MSAPANRAYPLPRPDADSRFSMGLILDVATALEAAGFPPIREGADIVALQQALFGFIYEGTR